MALLLCGCTSTNSVAPLHIALSQDHIPLEEEVWAIAQADKIHAQLLSQGMIKHDADASNLITSVKNRLLVQQPETAEHIRIYLLRSPQANAAALPNGVIYIHAGLFPILEDEDQLAAIIGHEIAHIVERHSLKAVINQKNTFISAHVADVMTGGLGLVYFPALASLSSFSREQEQAADIQSLAWLEAAGYRPAAATEAFVNFSTIPGANHTEASIYSSHPSQEDRISALKILTPVEQPTQSQGPNPSPEFLAVRVAQTEATVKMNLRDHRYIAAEADLERIERHLGQQSKIEYYRGEIHFGRAHNPGDAAREAYWIDTGKTNWAEVDYSLMAGQKEVNLRQAIAHYNRAVNEKPSQANARKRLGQVYLNLEEREEALYWLHSYLQTDPPAGDARYAQSLINKAEQL